MMKAEKYLAGMPLFRQSANNDGDARNGYYMSRNATENWFRLRQSSV